MDLALDDVGIKNGTINYSEHTKTDNPPDRVANSRHRVAGRPTSHRQNITTKTEYKFNIFDKWLF